jgi:glycosyltransferase involved in cell wall biosynthesis
LLEALAAGKPVVVADIAPMNEILQHYDKADRQPGVLVPPGDATALAEALAALLSDAELRQHMGVSGEKLVRQRYHIAGMAASYRQLYQELSQ